MIGAIAANFHEGSRSEYLAQYIFSGFGTAIPVPHQEDTGLDLYCTLLERIGQRAWPRAYYTVQVKSTMDPWVFDGPESVRWLLEYPLPIFLCIVDNDEARLRVYQTAPRFAAWVLPQQPQRLELKPGTEEQGHAVEWGPDATSYSLSAPILDFTIKDVLKQSCRDQVANVLTFWIDFDVANLFRIKSGIHRFWAPSRYETNSAVLHAWSGHGGRFREESVPVAIRHLKEIIGLMATQYYLHDDLVSAALYAMFLRYISPEFHQSEPLDEDGMFDPDPHDVHLHHELNRKFGTESSTYLYDAADSLLGLVKDELAKHGIGNGD